MHASSMRGTIKLYAISKTIHVKPCLHDRNKSAPDQISLQMRECIVIRNNHMLAEHSPIHLVKNLSSSLANNYPNVLDKFESMPRAISRKGIGDRGLLEFHEERLGVINNAKNNINLQADGGRLHLI